MRFSSLQFLETPIGIYLDVKLVHSEPLFVKLKPSHLYFLGQGRVILKRMQTALLLIRLESRLVKLRSDFVAENILFSHGHSVSSGGSCSSDSVSTWETNPDS